MLPIGEWGTGNGEVSILELELRTQTSPQNENLMRNILNVANHLRQGYGGQDVEVLQ